MGESKRFPQWVYIVLILLAAGGGGGGAAVLRDYLSSPVAAATIRPEREPNLEPRLAAVEAQQKVLADKVDAVPELKVQFTRVESKVDGIDEKLKPISDYFLQKGLTGKGR